MVEMDFEEIGDMWLTCISIHVTKDKKTTYIAHETPQYMHACHVLTLSATHSHMFI